MVISSALDENQFSSLYKKIVVCFLEKVDYSLPGPRNVETTITMTPIYQSLCSEFSAYNQGDEVFEAICLTAATYVELPYPDHEADIRLQIARFTWYMLYIDDQGHKNPSALRAFQQSVLINQSLEDTPLQGFRDHLADMYRFWGTIQANCIATSAMECITGCLLEIEPAINDMEPSTIASSWPYFLRGKTGAPAAYAFFIFPMGSNAVKLSTYIQVIEDIGIYINLSNDLLSFHKEMLAGETNNYVHNRARATRKSIVETLYDVAHDAAAAHYRVTRALQLTDGFKAWKCFADGNIDFYFALKRYRLSDLGL